MDLKEFIVDKASELNIDLIGFTDSSPFTGIEEYLKYRMTNMRFTEFEEEDIKKRIDPRLTMTNCKSIIVIGLSYNVDYDEKPDFEYKGILSRSSWGLDYHIVLKNKIELLIEEIKKVKVFEYKYFVDTGPLVDRELAHRAGIGYYGKNCSIINEEYGSFIFIGYILTDFEIQVYDKAKESQCGDCDLCLRACPTNALEKEKIINPKKCISYLTQAKGELNDQLKDKMGIRIYGCDTCQLVCPKNKDVKKSTHEEFLPKITKGTIDIQELLIMSNREFKEKYGHMAGSWRGKKILQRNAINALNNQKNSINYAEIEEMICSKDK